MRKTISYTPKYRPNINADLDPQSEKMLQEVLGDCTDLTEDYNNGFAKEMGKKDSVLIPAKKSGESKRKKL